MKYNNKYYYNNKNIYNIRAISALIDLVPSDLQINTTDSTVTSEFNIKINPSFTTIDADYLVSTIVSEVNKIIMADQRVIDLVSHDMSFAIDGNLLINIMSSSFDLSAFDTLLQATFNQKVNMLNTSASISGNASMASGSAENIIGNVNISANGFDSTWSLSTLINAILSESGIESLPITLKIDFSVYPDLGKISTSTYVQTIKAMIIKKIEYAEINMSKRLYAKANLSNSSFRGIIVRV
jgi:hypothetical protein